MTKFKFAIEKGPHTNILFFKRHETELIYRDLQTELQTPAWLYLYAFVVIIFEVRGSPKGSSISLWSYLLPIKKPL